NLRTSRSQRRVPSLPSTRLASRSGPMRSLVKRTWPFSYFMRLERKIDAMSSKAEQLKAALDSIAGHFSGLKSGIESIQANLAAAAQASKEDPMIDAALSEANDLATKFGALEEAIAPHAEIPTTESPAPAPSPPQEPAPAPAAASEPGE